MAHTSRTHEDALHAHCSVGQADGRGAENIAHRHRQFGTVVPRRTQPEATHEQQHHPGSAQAHGLPGAETGHGFRGLASTILHEQGFDHNHIELQLAHTARDKVSAAYNHAKYLEQRTTLMQHWADYLDAVVRGNVVTGGFRKVA